VVLRRSLTQRYMKTIPVSSCLVVWCD